MARISQEETIEIYDERPDKPFDRDTETRLTGEQLAARGAVDLGTALSLLPDVTVRDAGRGGFNVDIRGARNGAVTVMIDGVSVTDPYYGTFDVSSIPITDIVEIRIASTPQSPIDGPGGPGGVIEVHTRDASGPQLEIVRVYGDTLPTFGVSGTARAALTDHLALRISMSGQAGAHEYDTPGNQTIDKTNHAGTGAARLEYRRGQLRIALDGFLDDRHYLSPPADEGIASFLLIDRERTGRASLKVDDKLGTVQVQGQAWFQGLQRGSRYFSDPELAAVTESEDLTALRMGGMALVTAPFSRDWRWAVSGVLDRESVAVNDLSTHTWAAVIDSELAGDVQYEHETVRVDASVGVAITAGVDADPWPEGKLQVRYRPSFGSLELVGTAARKGRLPTLRERFEPITGNPDLGPEKIDELELRAIETVTEKVRFELAPFYKHSTGTVRSSPDLADAGKLINLGALDYYGVDALGRVRVCSRAEVGGSWDYVKVKREAQDGTEGMDDPLNRLPHNRWDAWAQVTPLHSLSLLARVTYFGRFIDMGSTGQVTLSGFTLASATATWAAARGSLIVLRLDDAFDSRPQTRAGYLGDGRTLTAIYQGQW
ncbi:MAG TPA: TonB-dependent receptor [Kofleriaceae bacterium]